MQPDDEIAPAVSASLKAPRKGISKRREHDKPQDGKEGGCGKRKLSKSDGKT